jgi:hypothetical protein
MNSHLRKIFFGPVLVTKSEHAPPRVNTGETATRGSQAIEALKVVD